MKCVTVENINEIIERHKFELADDVTLNEIKRQILIVLKSVVCLNEYNESAYDELEINVQFDPDKSELFVVPGNLFTLAIIFEKTYPMSFFEMNKERTVYDGMEFPDGSYAYVDKENNQMILNKGEFKVDLSNFTTTGRT